MKKFKKNKIKTLNYTAFIVTLAIMIGCYLISYNYLKTKKTLAFDNMNIDNYKEETKEVDLKKEVVQTSQVTKITTVKKTTNYNYIGYLEIPKIKLKKGFLDKSSPYNNVEKNITVLPASTYPDIAKSNLIIVGHSGDGYKAYFEYLYKLNTGDIARVTYNNHTYTYKLVNINEQPKTGEITIDRNYDKKVLTLITCTYKNDTLQSVYIFEEVL